MKALYKFIELRNGELPTFKIYSMDFRDFIKKPTFSIKDYVLMEASQDPETYFLRKKTKNSSTEKQRKYLNLLIPTSQIKQMMNITKKNIQYWPGCRTTQAGKSISLCR